VDYADGARPFQNNKIHSLSSLFAANDQLPDDIFPVPNLVHVNIITPPFKHPTATEHTRPISQSPSLLAFTFPCPDFEELNGLIAAGDDETAFLLCPACPGFTFTSELSSLAVVAWSAPRG
jgi:hypothetical protein